MYANTALLSLASLAAAASIPRQAESQYGITTVRFLARALSDDPAINRQVLGQFHTPSGATIADLYPVSTGDVQEGDLVYLAGETSTDLFQLWDQTLEGSAALHYAVGGENQPLVIKDAAAEDEGAGLIRGLYTGGNGPITHVDENFTFTACTIEGGAEGLPKIYVSYLDNKNNELAENCKPITFESFQVKGLNN